MKYVSSPGPCWYNSNQKNRCLPPPAHEPGQAAAHDRGDHRQRQGARPDWAHLLAIYKWGTGTQAEVMLFLYYLWPLHFSSAAFLHTETDFCVSVWKYNPSTFPFSSVSLFAAHEHLQPFLFQLTAVCWERINRKAWACKWIIIPKLCKNNADFISFGVTEPFVISCPIYFLLASLMAEITRCQIKSRTPPSPSALLEHWWWLVRAVPFSWQMTGDA